MDAEKVLKLVEAGFTKDEIMALAAPKQEAPAPDPEPTPAPDVKKNSGSSIDSLVDKVADLEKLIQAQNRQSVVIDTAKPETANDIFKSVFGLELDTSNREVN